MNILHQIDKEWDLSDPGLRVLLAQLNAMLLDIADPHVQLVYLPPESAEKCVNALRFVQSLILRGYKLDAALPAAEGLLRIVNPDVLAALFAVMSIDAISSFVTSPPHSTLLWYRGHTLPFDQADSFGLVNYCNGTWDFSLRDDNTLNEPAWKAFESFKDSDQVNELLKKLWLAKASDDIDLRKSLVQMQLGARAVAHCVGSSDELVQVCKALDPACNVDPKVRLAALQLLQSLPVNETKQICEQTHYLWLPDYIGLWTENLTDWAFAARLLDTVATFSPDTAMVPALVSFVDRIRNCPPVATAAVKLIKAAQAEPQYEVPESIISWISTTCDADFLVAVLDLLSCTMKERLDRPIMEACVDLIIARSPDPVVDYCTAILTTLVARHRIPQFGQVRDALTELLIHASTWPGTIRLLISAGEKGQQSDLGQAFAMLPKCDLDMLRPLAPEISTILASMPHGLAELLEFVMNDCLRILDEPSYKDKTGLANCVFEIVFDCLKSTDAIYKGLDVLLVKLVTHPALPYDFLQSRLSRITLLLLVAHERRPGSDEMVRSIIEMTRDCLNKCLTGMEQDWPQLEPFKELLRLAHLLYLVRIPYFSDDGCIPCNGISRELLTAFGAFVADATPALAEILAYSIRQQALAFSDVEVDISVGSFPFVDSLSFSDVSLLPEVYMPDEVQQSLALPESRMPALEYMKAARLVLRTLEISITTFFGGIVGSIELDAYYTHSTVGIIDGVIKSLLPLLSDLFVPNADPTVQRVAIEKTAGIWPSILRGKNLNKEEPSKVAAQLFVQQGGIEALAALLNHTLQLPDDGLFIPQYFATGAEPTNLIVETQSAIFKAFQSLPLAIESRTTLFSDTVQKYGHNISPTMLCIQIKARIWVVLNRDKVLWFSKMASVVLQDQLYPLVQACLEPEISISPEAHDFNPNAFFALDEIANMLDSQYDATKAFLMNRIETQQDYDLWSLADVLNTEVRLPPEPALVTTPTLQVSTAAYDKQRILWCKGLPQLVFDVLGCKDKGAVLALFYRAEDTADLSGTFVNTGTTIGLDKIFTAITKTPTSEGLKFVACILLYLEYKVIIPECQYALSQLLQDVVTLTLVDRVPKFTELRGPASAVVEALETWRRQNSIHKFCGKYSRLVMSWDNEKKIQFLDGKVLVDDAAASTCMVRTAILLCMDDYHLAEVAVQKQFVLRALEVAIQEGPTAAGVRLGVAVRTLSRLAVETPRVQTQLMSIWIDSMLASPHEPASMSTLMVRNTQLLVEGLESVDHLSPSLPTYPMLRQKRILAKLAGHFKDMEDPSSSEVEGSGAVQKLMNELVSQLPPWDDNLVVSPSKVYVSPWRDVRIYNLSVDENWQRFKKRAHQMLLVLTVMTETQAVSCIASDVLSEHSKLFYKLCIAMVYTRERPRPQLDPAHEVCEEISWKILALFCSFTRLEMAATKETLPLVVSRTRLVFKLVASVITDHYNLSNKGFAYNLLYMQLRLSNALLGLSLENTSWRTIVDHSIARTVAQTLDIPALMAACVTELDPSHPVASLVTDEYQAFCVALSQTEPRSASARYDINEFPAEIRRARVPGGVYPRYKKRTGTVRLDQLAVTFKGIGEWLISHPLAPVTLPSGSQMWTAAKKVLGGQQNPDVPRDVGHEMSDQRSATAFVQLLPSAGTSEAWDLIGRMFWIDGSAITDYLKKTPDF